MEIIAHRGASGYAPENTLLSFKKAIEMGSHAVEFDVQMTADGKLVVIHDETLERTTDGKGFVIYSNYDYIKGLSAGKWFGAAYEDERVPTLEEVLDLYNNKTSIHLEIKKMFIDKRNIEDKIYDTLKNVGMLENVKISSFNHRTLKYMSDNYDLEIGMLTASGMVEVDKYINNSGIRVSSINPSGEYVDEEFVKVCHDNNYKVYSYTVNEQVVAKKFQEFGVDGIYTNYPNIMQF